MGAKLTQEQVVKRIEKKQEGQYEVIGTYTTKDKPIKIRCRDCGLEWPCIPNSLFRNRIGKDCKHHINLNQNMAKQRIANITDGNISMTGKYIGAKTPTRMYCNVCAHEWDTEPYVIYGMGMGCPKCSGKAPRSTEQYKQEVSDLVGDEYVVIGEYTGTHNPVKLLHKKCGNFCYPSPKNFLFAGHRYPLCQSSHGEMSVRKYLTEKDISFKEQVRFSNCKDKGTLPFDFVVYQNNSIVCAIEYQGIQHYERGWFDHDEEGLESRQRRDNIKREYCANNNIDLIEIPCHEMSLSMKESDKLVKKYLDSYFVTSRD